MTSTKLINGSATQLVTYLGWLVAVCLAFMLLWIGQLFFASQAEKTILLQEQELTRATIRSLQNQLEAERILSNHQRHLAEQEIKEIKQKLQD